ncbi:TPA: fimbrial protein [Escherichia coli]|nr:fimbrial protein [Escherichia coli]EQU22058.1 outer membrane usher protein, type 1 fimbrial synthesis [Escherichia coli HVH 197 (4-4466217)]EFC2613541.1 fimbria/pilus outer membrane usher protein [Escherichia coli]EFG3998340.1 fimbria/pilus outer membrane usher protein [Escherichia coli]ELK6042729.1 fimbria/pilus outer membrane usher protein [Escherichia coli]
MNNTTPIKILTAAVLLTFGFALTANAALINKGVTEMNHEYTVSDTLSARQQVIPLIAASMASSQMDKLNAALNQGLDAGLTINEAKEILIQLYAYTGFPRSLNALNELMKVVETRKQRGIEDIEGKAPIARIPVGDELRRVGTANQTKISGAPVQGPLFDFAPTINQFLQTHLFGDIFARDNLDWQSRELATVGALAATPGVEAQLLSHTRASLRVGLTAAQLRQLAQVLREHGDNDAATRADEALQKAGREAPPYSFNGNSINNRSNHNAGKSNYAYLNLQSGINIGSWRLRDNSTWSYNSGSSNSSDSNKWQHINTSAERDIIPLRSRLTVGDSYTDGDIFDSVNFRGLKINSTEAMLPDSQHGFAPVIHGIARGTAQVSVKQNGYDVYQTTVPPGPFTIDDINSAANGGDLQVTIKEADGSIQTLYVPYSSVPVLQRAGYTRYALAMGEYRSGNNLQSTPKFVQASLMHGLKGNWTPYGGMQIAEDYQAFNLGIGKDLGLFSAFSFDITQANTTLADDTRHSGQSVKSVYSKSFYQTGTNIQVAGYRYSTQGFYNLSDSAYSRMSGYTVKPPTGDTSEQTLFIDYFNLFYSKRGQEQISISQQLGNYGTTFFSASRQSYWNTSRSDQQISFGLNVPFGDITTSLNYSYSNNIWQNDRDHLLAFTLNVPFSHWMRTDSQSAFHNSNASYSMSNDLKGGMTNLSGVYGTLLPDNNLNYSVQVGNTHGSNTSSGTSGYSSLNYRGAYGNTNVGYSRSGDSSQIYYGMSGGIIAHADGITFGQPLGDTMVLVKAPGADNVKIENQTGIHTDWRGYAILPFATEYRENRVALNANSLADNVELDETVVTVIPTHGAIARATFNVQIGGKVLMTLKYGNKSVPFGAIVTHGENKNGSIVAENGQVYLTGLPQSGKLQVSWGNDKNSNCIVEYKLPEVSPGTLLNQQTAICR